MGKRGKLLQMQKEIKRFKEFPAAIASQTHRAIIPELWQVIREFKNSTALRWNLLACALVAVLTITYRFGTELGIGMYPAFLTSAPRIVAIGAFLLVKDNVVFPFSMQALQEQFKGELIPSLLNELMRMCLQCTTAYLCSYDQISSVMISFLWCVCTLVETLTVLDLGLFNRVLHHPTDKGQLSKTEVEINHALASVNSAIKQQYNVLWHYVWFQYVLYSIYTLFPGAMIEWLTSGHWSALVFRTLHLVLIAFLICSVYCLHHWRHLAHQACNIQMMRFALRFMICHIMGGLIWLLILKPKLNPLNSSIDISSFWIGSIAALSILSIAVHEIRNILPMKAVMGEEEEQQPAGTASGTAATQQTQGQTAIQQGQATQANKPEKKKQSSWTEVDSVSAEGKKLKVEGNPYIIQPYFPASHVLVQQYDHLLLLQLGSWWSPEIQSALYLIMLLVETPLFLWTQHFIWLLVFLLPL